MRLGIQSLTEKYSRKMIVFLEGEKNCNVIFLTFEVEPF